MERNPASSQHSLRATEQKHDVKIVNLVDSAEASLKAVSDNFRDPELDTTERTSMDSDCSLYEIESEGRHLLMLDLAIEGDACDDASFLVSPPSPLFSSSNNRQKYRAWIGARNLHIA